jgi:DNA polymerase-3 subunit epsilon
MSKNVLVVFDTETGGLKPKENPIMEIALVALDMKTLDEVGRWETLVKPYNGLKYDQAALDIHGISISEATNKGVSLEEMVATTIKFYKQFTPKGGRGGGRPILSGHNLPFDNGMLKEAFSLAGYNLFDFVLSNGEEISVFDTLPISKFVWPSEDKHTLGECCKRAGMGDFTAHRAMPDVIASCDLIRFFRSLTGGKASASVKKEVEGGSKGRELIKTNRKVKFQF